LFKLFEIIRLFILIFASKRGDDMFKFIILFIFISIYTVSGTEYICDGSSADCQAKINTAANGDTVTIVDGVHTWNSGVSIRTGIYLRGSIASNVTIIGSAAPKISVQKNSVHPIFISGLSFTGGSNYIQISGSWSARPVVIANCTFSMNGGTAIFAQIVGGAVISGCDFQGNGNYNDQAVKHKLSSDSQSWSTPPTLGMEDVNGDRNLYFEDCTGSDCPQQFIDIDDASRIVIRNNVFNNCEITSHGWCTSPVGLRHFEVYRNDFNFEACQTNRCNLNRYLFIRGGSGVIWGNSMDDIRSSYWGSKDEVHFAIRNIQDECGHGARCPVYPDDYPIPRQTGMGFDGTSDVPSPIYLWSNTGTLVVGFASWADACGNNQITSQWIAEGRDYIYSEKPGYEPYTYPHPLTSGITQQKVIKTPDNVRIKK
jgi:hypothetical protein